MTPILRQTVGALKLAGRLLGEETYRINKLPGEFVGIFNQLSRERSLDEDGGRKTTYSAILVSAAIQFRSEPALGMLCTVRGKEMRINKIESDDIAYTLYLGNFNV